MGGFLRKFWELAWPCRTRLFLGVIVGLMAPLTIVTIMPVSSVVFQPAAGDWDQEARTVVEESPVVKVPVTTLDEDLADVPDIALLKIDCEGFEGGILQGARRLIARHRPALFLEIHPTELEKFGSSVPGVLDFLAPYYEMEFWSFEHDWPASKLGQSLAKFKRRQGYHYPDAQAMLADAAHERRPSQVYCVGRPK